MPEYWIGDAEGRVLGPVSLDVVQDLVNTGRLLEITRVSRDGRSWGAPASFPEVMTLLVNAPSPDALLQSERQEAARVREQLRAMMGRPPHEIFRLDRTASVDAYRNAFFKLVKRFYPDRVRAQAHADLRKAYSDAFQFLSRLMVHIEKELAAGGPLSPLPMVRAVPSPIMDDEPLTPVLRPSSQTGRPLTVVPRSQTPLPRPSPLSPPAHQGPFSYQPHEFVGFERRDDRVEVTIKVTARNSRMFTEHPLANLRTDGFFLACAKSLPLGTLVDVIFRFEEEKREVRSRGRVILENTGGDAARPSGFGVRFITLVDQDRRFMQQFVERTAVR
ncbi:MAG TPA: PilZ domain-containing protein [Myxococcaceae bacterium]|nr:PilZ domain-containing protein [Myxococcaceae bacterium]